jgi:hypothetical protein
MQSYSPSHPNRMVGRLGHLSWVTVWSGCPDSNRGPPAPKAGALTKLRHIPLEPNVAYRPAEPGSAPATVRRSVV